MIDLHTHTNCSDGADDYKTLLTNAQKAGITILSITDHDNCKVYEQMKDDDITKYYKGILIKGVELQCLVNGKSIELLGYGVNTDIINKKVKEIYKSFEEINLIEMNRLYQNCKKIGMKFDDNVIERYDQKEFYYATEYLHHEMRKHSENRIFIKDDDAWESESVFFRKYTTNINSDLYVDESDIVPSAEEVANLIKEADGLVFIPHIFQYEDKSLEILEYLIDNCPIDGIECFYPTFTIEQRELIYNYAKEHNKYISGGSDYHGENRPKTKIGTGIYNNLNVTEEIVEEWIKKLNIKNII